MERVQVIGGLAVAFLLMCLLLFVPAHPAHATQQPLPKVAAELRVSFAERPQASSTAHVLRGELSVKDQVQNRIIAHCRTLSLSTRETAFVLALCEVESGFNPRAANKTSSAKGLFQFVNGTRKELARRAGVSARDPYCIEMQLACLTEQLRETFPIAARKAGARGTDTFFAWAYAYHHDGPSFRYGGYALAEKRLVPRLDHYEALVLSR